MPRTSPLYYIAPSAISITPNANGSQRDLAVYVARGAKVKLYDPRIAALGMGTDSTFQEWTLSGRNRRLADTTGAIPYTIYARLAKTGEKTGYLVFAAQTHPEGSEEWADPYILSPNTSATTAMNDVAGADGNTKYSWAAIPTRQAEAGRSDYWWVKMGTVSAPDENGQRTVDLDTGILGTDEYNSKWHLNPDDLPDKEVRYMLEDRGQWTATPKVVYTGPTGQRTPDGTLDSTVAAALGWTGEEPLAFTNGQQIDEPYHYRSLTRLRWLTQRLSADNDDLTDADLYAKLTGTTKGWEPENTLEVSRVWNGGALWECKVEGTKQRAFFGTDWERISGGTFSLGFYTDGDNPTPIIGFAVRPGFVNETAVPYLLFGQEDISSLVTAWSWVRESNNSALDETWRNTAHTDPEDNTSPLKSVTRIINVTDADLPEGWGTGSGKVSFKCTARFLDSDGEEAEIINSIKIV